MGKRSKNILKTLPKEKFDSIENQDESQHVESEDILGWGRNNTCFLLSNRHNQASETDGCIPFSIYSHSKI